MKSLKEWKKRREFLVCVDSDGCAMDTMDCKHFLCFGPCMVEEWGLEAWREPVLKRWNEINLYTMTRGINRFKGLTLALTEIDRTYRRIEGIEELKNWTDHAKELSNSALEKALETSTGSCMRKALSWSYKVNEAINNIPEDKKKPFKGVLEGLAAAGVTSDVAVVSSANREAVEEEWNRCGLSEYVDVLCCQDAGSKTHCIEMLRAKGYASDQILMVGDAPGDLEAAKKNNVFFYPILTRHEEESWSDFHVYALEKFISGDFEIYGKEKEVEFLRNLGNDPKNC